MVTQPSLAVSQDPYQQPAFSARGLVKTYQTEAGEVSALRGIDLDLREGEFVVMLGPSGSGKSTFLNILGGLDSPSSGEIFFQGIDLAGLSEGARTVYRRERVGFVFQFYNLMPGLSAVENVSLAAEIARDPLPPKKRSRWSVSGTVSTISPPSCPAASSSASRSRGRSRSARACCCATSRPVHSTARRG
jgi:ABC-type sugar transport system ATPase subunit